MIAFALHHGIRKQEKGAARRGRENEPLVPPRNMCLLEMQGVCACAIIQNRHPNVQDYDDDVADIHFEGKPSLYLRSLATKPSSAQFWTHVGVGGVATVAGLLFTTLGSAYAIQNADHTGDNSRKFEAGVGMGIIGVVLMGVGIANWAATPVVSQEASERRFALPTSAGSASR